MKINITQFNEMINQNLLTLTFFFLLSFASSTLLNSATNSSNYNSVSIENKIQKMSVIPDPEVENHAIVALHSLTTEATIVIFNSMGIVILEENFKVEKDQENSIQLDLTSLEAGTYYILHDESNDSATYSVR